MNAFIRRESVQAVAALHRNFSFGNDCVYGAIHSGNGQITSINDLNRDFGKTVYYLLYNPHELPFSINYPLRERFEAALRSAPCSRGSPAAVTAANRDVSARFTAISTEISLCGNAAQCFGNSLHPTPSTLEIHCNKRTLLITVPLIPTASVPLIS
jgi:hypothetical protein